MAYTATFVVDAPERAEIDAQQGLLLLEFGVDWCPHCQLAQPLLERALQDYPALRHLKVEDGPGRRLGRSFRIKLWPSLLLIKDGQELERLVRPTTEAEIAAALARLAAA
jgi:thioredoxin 1